LADNFPQTNHPTKKKQWHRLAQDFTVQRPLNVSFDCLSAPIRLTCIAAFVLRATSEGGFHFEVAIGRFFASLTQPTAAESYQGCQIFLGHDTKAGKNLPNEQKIFQTIIKYPKCP
jgi:hypothetical protein